MYSQKKIPAPFDHPQNRTAPKAASATPTPAAPKEEPRVEAVPIGAKEKTSQKPKTSSTSPLAALLLLEFFSKEK